MLSGSPRLVGDVAQYLPKLSSYRSDVDGQERTEKACFSLMECQGRTVDPAFRPVGPNASVDKRGRVCCSRHSFAVLLHTYV